MTPKIAPNPAFDAYAQALGRVQGGTGGAATEAKGPSFAEMLAETLTDAVETGRRGEAQASAAMTGEAPLQDVVDAVNAAELSLQTVVAVRDRMIAAYQEIMRMPI